MAATLLASAWVSADAASKTSAHRDTSPSITAVSPPAGPPRGGNSLTIRGTLLRRVTAVSFGGVRSREITHTSGSRISVVVPAHAVGAVTVRLVVGGRPGADSATYRFVPPPTQLRWSRDHTIDPDVGYLYGLSCPTRHFCASVEGSVAVPAIVTFSPHGTIVQRHELPKNAGAPALSCSSRALCFAVEAGRVSRWNGHRWSRFVPLGRPRVGPDTVSCVTGTRYCVALNGNGPTWVHRPSGWTRAGNGPALYDGGLECVSVRFCMLVSNGRAYRFDGTSWHHASRGLPSYLQYSDLPFGCASPSFCLAVGEYESYRWNGTRWRSTAAYFAQYGTAVACPSRHLCLLSGEDGSAEWRDGHWYSDPAKGDRLESPAISCADHRWCAQIVRSGVLIHDASGWSAPHFIEAMSGDLTDVSCVSASRCMAVDSYGNAIRRGAEGWQRPHRVDGRRPINAVSCAGRVVCVAVDGAVSTIKGSVPGVGRTVVYRDGRWGAPVVSDPHFGLTDVACASAHMCMAVDDGGNAIRWNGRTWSRPQHVGTLLDAVACPTASHCLAVGAHSAEWRRGRWRVMRNPAGFGQLFDVTCPDDHDCAVGGDTGFAIRHAGVWSSAVQRARWLYETLVACMSRTACFGSEDNDVDVWDYAFDGARVAFSADQIYGPKISCVPTVCVSVSLSFAETGEPFPPRPVAARSADHGDERLGRRPLVAAR